MDVGPVDEQANGGTSHVAISEDGRHVTFLSGASNLVPSDTNGQVDVFLRSLDSSQTVRVSVAYDGTQANDTSSNLFAPAVTRWGERVAFYSWASNLVPSDTNNYCDFGGQSNHNCADAFVRSTWGSDTIRVSLANGDLGPDLIITDMYSAQTFQNYCYTPAGLMVVVKNVGTASAGPTNTRLSGGGMGTVYLDTPTLAPGESIALWAYGSSAEEFTATADAMNVVNETDETNNTLTKYVAVMTLPTCEPSPPPGTPAPPLTATPTATATQLAADPVGGIAEPPDEAQTSGGSGSSTDAIAALVAGAVIVAMTGGWLARRRFRR